MTVGCKQPPAKNVSSKRGEKKTEGHLTLRREAKGEQKKTISRTFARASSRVWKKKKNPEVTEGDKKTPGTGAEP